MLLHVFTCTRHIGRVHRGMGGKITQETKPSKHDFQGTFYPLINRDSSQQNLTLTECIAIHIVGSRKSSVCDPIFSK